MKFTLRYTSVLFQKRSLLYFMSDNVLILEYDLARHNLALLHTPEQYGYAERFNILLAEGGELGFCQYSYPKLKVWTWEATTDAQWVPSRGIFLDSLLPIGSLVDVDSTVQVMGFAEEANVIFFNTASGIFTVEQQSQRVSKVFDKHGYGFCNVIPVVCFYTPVPRGQHRDPLLPGPSEEPCGEEGGEEVKTVDQAHQLFNKGSNAIKEGGLVNTFGCVRDPCCGEVVGASMEDKHGHALLSEAQEVTDPLGDVSNSPLNEELVKRRSTSSKDDDGNSKAPGSNVEDAAPTSGKDDSEEVLLC